MFFCKKVHSKFRVIAEKECKNFESNFCVVYNGTKAAQAGSPMDNRQLFHVKVTFMMTS